MKGWSGVGDLDVVRLGPVRDPAAPLRGQVRRVVVGLLEQWEYELEYAYHRSRRTWVLGGIVDHAVACVGAWQREDVMPEPNLAFRRAKESAELKEEEGNAPGRWKRSISVNGSAGKRHGLPGDLVIPAKRLTSPPSPPRTH